MMSKVVQREFEARKINFRAFCDSHAVTEAAVVRYLEGRGNLHEEVVTDLAEMVGLSRRRFESLAA